MANRIEHLECPACNGSGWIWDSETAGLRRKCVACDGKGYAGRADGDLNV